MEIILHANSNVCSGGEGDGDNNNNDNGDNTDINNDNNNHNINTGRNNTYDINNNDNAEKYADTTDNTVENDNSHNEMRVPPSTTDVDNNPDDNKAKDKSDKDNHNNNNNNNFNIPVPQLLAMIVYTVVFYSQLDHILINLCKYNINDPDSQVCKVLQSEMVMTFNQLCTTPPTDIGLLQMDKGNNIFGPIVRSFHNSLVDVIYYADVLKSLQNNNSNWPNSTSWRIDDFTKWV